MVMVHQKTPLTSIHFPFTIDRDSLVVDGPFCAPGYSASNSKFSFRVPRHEVSTFVVTIGTSHRECDEVEFGCDPWH